MYKYCSFADILRLLEKIQLDDVAIELWRGTEFIP